jgi:phosphate transport system protein
MERHFHQELKELKEEIFKMGLTVEAAIEKAVRALIEKDSRLSKQVFEEEKKINEFEIRIDDQGHNLFALGQPMAVDLRLITAILKMNTDLERIGDHAVNIAERAVILAGEPPLERLVQVPEMAQAVQKMFKDALESFINSDITLAQNVLIRDDEVDAYNDSLYLQLQKLMEKDSSMIKTGMLLVRVGHDLERIGDLANNIAEDVIYLKQGKEVRHHTHL